MDELASIDIFFLSIKEPATLTEGEGLCFDTCG